MRPILFLLPLALAAQTPPPKPGTVEGAVVESASGAPVRDCTVILQDQTRNTGRFRYIAVTDDRGHFTFPKVEPDSAYSTEAQCAGFTMPDDTRQTRRDSAPFAVAEDQHVRDITVKLVPLGSISGKIVDPDGDALRGVSVQALQYRYVAAGRRLDVVADSTTDALGRYRLFFLKPGRYIVRAFLRETPPGPVGEPGHVHDSVPAEGFLPAWHPGPPEGGAASALTIAPAAAMAGLDFHLARTPVYDIRGTLITDLAKPPAVIAAACSTGGIDRGYSFPADVRPDHSFDARAVPPGQYCLAAPQGSMRWANADTIVVVGDHDVEGVTITAAAPSAIQGSIRVDDAAHPLPRLAVYLQSTAATSCCEDIAQVQADGTFVTRPVAPGSYLLRFPSLPQGVYLKSLQMGDQILHSNRIDVRPGLDKLSLVLGTDTGAVSGTVQDSDGNPGDHVLVMLAPKGDRAGRIDLLTSANTKPDGTFQIAGVAPGEYQVFAWEAYSDDLWSPDFLKLFADRAVTVSVDSAGSASVQLKTVSAKDIADAKWRSQ